MFEKNLILRYPFVCGGRAPLTTIYAFPYEDGVTLYGHALWLKGYLMKYPPHEPLHRAFVKKLVAGVSERLLYLGEKKEAKISHADGEGEWNVDEVLKFRLNGQTEKWFIETLTGSEGYGKRILRRLLTAKAYLRENPQDHVIYFLVTEREVQKNGRADKKK